MNKVTIFLTLIASICFLLCNANKYDVLEEITSDFDNTTYIYIGCKEYTKESVIEYYKQVLRYVCYFIYFIDIKNLESVTFEKTSDFVVSDFSFISRY